MARLAETMTMCRLFPLLLIMLAAPASLVAKPLVPGQELDELRSELGTLKQAVEVNDGTLQARRKLSESRQRLQAIRAQARECIADVAAKRVTLTTRREVLGELSRDEGSEVTALRRELDGEINQAEISRVACEQLVQVSQGLLDNIDSRAQAALTARLFARGPSTAKILVGSISEPRAWSRLAAGFLDEGSGWERLSGVQRGLALAVFAGLAVLGYAMVRRRAQRHSLTGAGRQLAVVLPWLLAFAGLAALLSVFLPAWPPILVTRLALGILVWLAIDLVKRIWIVGRHAAGLSGEDARSLSRWLGVLIALIIAGGLVITAEAVIGLPDAHYFLLRTIMAWVLVVALAWLAIILGRVPGLAGTATLRMLLVLAALAIAVAETSGFRNLALYLLLGISGTAAGFYVATILSRSVVALFDEIDEGRRPWQRSLRTGFGLQSGEPVPGLVWLRLASWLLVWSTLVLWTLWVWGQSERWISRLVEYATQGFEVGSLHIAPVQLLGAIAILALGISLTRWLKQRVIPDLVSHSRLDRGGREAIVTVSGYAGITLSLIIALGVAGISYTNLAIIAGALSVGIGFGLQNVVNNFISGLILLFERPIRTGDWIVVGDTQGYVRKISIRSTQVETFDRADVIVPNSELIANKVSNWMLRDPWGRITIPVGVAYGSDVKKVVDILLQVANEHEGVLREQPGVAPPKAIFRRFGDSALEFELRCFIRQIDRIFDITHDLNMAIDRAFREAGITIPFPQRDVHVKTLPPGIDRKPS